jgi:hypothetical protein
VAVAKGVEELGKPQAWAVFEVSTRSRRCIMRPGGSTNAAAGYGGPD